MEFNFYEHYQSYSNVELLKILEQSENYQRAAVEAAVLVLQEREISEQERVEVSSQMEVIQQKEQVKKERLDITLAKIKDFFEALLPPGKKVHPVKWLNILLLVVVYQYLIQVLLRIKFGFFLPLGFFNLQTVVYFILGFIDLAYLVYIPLALYLLYKRKQWGWIILFVHYMFVLIAQLSQAYFLFAYLDIHHANVAMYFVSVGLKVALLYFLWRKEVAGHFNVSPKTRRDTGLMALIGAIISIIFLFTVFS